MLSIGPLSASIRERDNNQNAVSASTLHFNLQHSCSEILICDILLMLSYHRDSLYGECFYLRGESIYMWAFWESNIVGCSKCCWI